MLSAVAALVLASAPTAHAQSSAPSERGVRAAELMLQAMDFRALILKEMSGDVKQFVSDVPSRPEWGGYLLDAMAEEVEHDLPAFAVLLGGVLAKQLTPDELKVGVQILSDPTMQAAMRTASSGVEPAEQPSRELEQLASSRSGRSFLKKLEGMETFIEPLQDEFVAELLPGAFRRFADKVDAAEQARKAATRR